MLHVVIGFQLTLKEGLTVFRDQCFSADMHDKGVRRTDDVSTLRAIQFPEDSSPTAHQFALTRLWK